MHADVRRPHLGVRVIIEHLMKGIVSLVSRIVVLHHGAKLSEGASAQGMRDPEVIKAYVGNKFAQTSGDAGYLAPGAAKPM